MPKGPGALERLGTRTRGALQHARALTLAAARTARRAGELTVAAARTHGAAWRDAPTERAVAPAVPRWADHALLAVAALFAISLVSNAFGVVARPEAGALYAAARVAEGARAYADVPSSAWPGHLALLALLAKLHLGGWAAAQGLAALATAAGAVFVFLATRTWGRAGRLVASLAMLLGFEPLLHATRPFGATFALALVAAATFALARDRSSLAGGLLGAAPWFHPAALVVSIPLLFKADPAHRRRTLLAAAAGFAAFLLLALALGGTAAITVPWRLALVHAAGPPALLRALPLATDDAFWLALAAIGPALVGPDSRRTARMLVLAAFLPIVLVLAHPAFDRTAMLVAWPALALAAGLSADAIAVRYLRWAASGADARAGRVALAALGLACLATAATDRLPIPNDERRPAPGAPEPTGVVGAPLRRLLWSGRGPGVRASFPRRLLWGVGERSSAFSGLVEAVSAQTAAGDTILGDGSLAPLVALATHRRLALELSDDAAARLPAADLAELRTRLDAAPPALVLATPRSLASSEALRPFVQQRYRVAGTFGDPVGWVYVHVRK